MPKPFPWPLNVGTDICSIPRIFNFLVQPSAPRFVRRILTTEEHTQYQSRIEPALERWRDMVQSRLRLFERTGELGLQSFELAHCFQLKEGGKNGMPVDWLRKFRQRQIDGVANGRIQERRPGKRDRSMTRELAQAESLKQIQDEQLAAPEPSTSVATIGPALVEGIDPDELDALLDLRSEFEVEHTKAMDAMREASAFMAGRFAAKEAVMKAHHNQRLTYHRISILPTPGSLSISGSRPPQCVVIPEGGDLEDGQEVRISISHDARYATAVCLSADPGVNSIPVLQENNEDKA